MCDVAGNGQLCNLSSIKKLEFACELTLSQHFVSFRHRPFFGEELELATKRVLATSGRIILTVGHHFPIVLAVGHYRTNES